MSPRNAVRKKSLLPNDLSVEPVKELPVPTVVAKDETKLPEAKPDVVSGAKEKLSGLSFRKGDAPTLC